MLKPVMLRCGHSGCQVCIHELLNNSNVHSRCPMCRADFEREDIRPNVALAKLTSELRVHCQSLDCGWSSKYGNAALHYQSCPKVPMQRQNDECGYVAARERIASHADSCPKRNLPCPECQREVKFESLSGALTKPCTLIGLLLSILNNLIRWQRGYPVGPCNFRERRPQRLVVKRPLPFPA